MVKALGTKISDSVAEDFERVAQRLGKSSSELLRDIIEAYLSNELGCCEDMIYAQLKMTVIFRDLFARIAEIYRKLRDTYLELYDMVYTTIKPFKSEKFIELEKSAKSVFGFGSDLEKYLMLSIEFLETLMTNKEYCRDFDSIIIRAIDDFKNILEDFEFIKNSLGLMGMLDSWLFLVEDEFKELPPEVRESIRDEIVRRAIKLRADILSKMDLKSAVKFIDFIMNLKGTTLDIINRICNGQLKDFQLPVEVCNKYHAIINKELDSSYLADIPDIAAKYGMDREEAKKRLRSLILTEEPMYVGLDIHLSEGALELLALRSFYERMSVLFDLPTTGSELPYLMKLIVDLEKARKKICLP